MLAIDTDSRVGHDQGQLATREEPPLFPGRMRGLSPQPAPQSAPSPAPVTAVTGLLTSSTVAGSRHCGHRAADIVDSRWSALLATTHPSCPHSHIPALAPTRPVVRPRKPMITEPGPAPTGPVVRPHPRKPMITDPSPVITESCTELVPGSVIMGKWGPEPPLSHDHAFPGDWRRPSYALLLRSSASPLGDVPISRAFPETGVSWATSFRRGLPNARVRDGAQVRWVTGAGSGMPAHGRQLSGKPASGGSTDRRGRGFGMDCLSLGAPAPGPCRRLTPGTPAPGRACG